MIYDDHFFKIEDQLTAVLDMVKSSAVFANYRQKRENLYNDSTAMQLKSVFEAKKNQFEQIASYGNFAPDYREKQRSVRKAKRALDLNETVADFRLAETDLQELLDEIGLTIAQTISDEIKVDAGNPFFETGGYSGCGGSCHAS